MGEILKFRPAEKTVDCPGKLSRPAKVYIFPGVRIERKEVSTVEDRFSAEASDDARRSQQKSKE